jgi:hypothetical protein
MNIFALPFLITTTPSEDSHSQFLFIAWYIWKARIDIRFQRKNEHLFMYSWRRRLTGKPISLQWNTSSNNTGLLPQNHLLQLIEIHIQIRPQQLHSKHATNNTNSTFIESTNTTSHQPNPPTAPTSQPSVFVRCQGPNGPGGPLGLCLGIRLNPYLGVK